MTKRQYLARLSQYFSMKKTQLGLKNDKFRHTRGGKSRLLSLACSHCQTHFGNYQKDGLREKKFEFGVY